MAKILIWQNNSRSLLKTKKDIFRMFQAPLILAKTFQKGETYNNALKYAL